MSQKYAGIEFSSYIGTQVRLTDGSQDSMVTRGVASVRSPVKNLREFSPTITHNTFVEAMVQAFREEYRMKEPVSPCHKSFRSANLLGQVQYVQASDAADSPYIQNGIAELHVKTLSPHYGFKQVLMAFSLGLELGIWSDPRVYILN
jgi:hypothetical protein